MNPPIPTRPMLYRQLFFLPLFLVELSTISLLTLLPSMRVTAYACYAVAGMFAVFAIWAAFGFAFPSQPLPLALNVISKILCFVAAIMLFAWRAGDKASGVQDEWCRIKVQQRAALTRSLSPPPSRRSAPCSRGSA